MTIERDPAECVHASIFVRLTRADGETVEIACESVARAADLVRDMNPRNVGEVLGELFDEHTQPA